MKDLDDKNKKFFESYAKSQALDRAINQKVFGQIINLTGFTPHESSEPLILAYYYKKALPDYIKDNKIDFARLDEELSRRNQSRIMLEKSALKEVSSSRAYETLRSLSFVTDLELLDAAKLATTNFSYRVIGIDQTGKDKMIRDSFIPDEKAIQDKFKTEFLSKDPKSILDNPKRESIKTTLFNERKPTLERDLIAKWQKMAQGNLSIDQLGATLGQRIIVLNDISLTADLDAKKGTDKTLPSLAALTQSDQFAKLRATAALGQLVGPIETGGSVYFFTVTTRKIPELPAASSYKQALQLKEALQKAKVSTSDFSLDGQTSQGSERAFNNSLNNIIELYKSRVRIIRYIKENNTEG